MTSMIESGASPRIGTGLPGDDASPVVVSNRTAGRPIRELRLENRPGSSHASRANALRGRHVAPMAALIGPDRDRIAVLERQRIGSQPELQGLRQLAVIGRAPAWMELAAVLAAAAGAAGPGQTAPALIHSASAAIWDSFSFPFGGIARPS